MDYQLHFISLIRKRLASVWRSCSNISWKEEFYFDHNVTQQSHFYTKKDHEVILATIDRSHCFASMWKYFQKCWRIDCNVFCQNWSIKIKKHLCAEGQCIIIFDISPTSKTWSLIVGRKLMRLFSTLRKLMMESIGRTCFAFWKKWALEKVSSTGFVFCTITQRRSWWLMEISHRPLHHNVEWNKVILSQHYFFWWRSNLWEIYFDNMKNMAFGLMARLSQLDYFLRTIRHCFQRHQMVFWRNSNSSKSIAMDRVRNSTWVNHPCSRWIGPSHVHVFPIWP